MKSSEFKQVLIQAEKSIKMVEYLVFLNFLKIH